jgi:hypothetical protein
MTGLPKCSWTNACDSRSYLCLSEIKLAHTDDDFLWRRDAASGQHEEALTLVVNALDVQKRGAPCKSSTGSNPAPRPSARAELEYCALSAQSDSSHRIPIQAQICGWVHVVAGMVTAGFECNGQAGRGHHC